MIETYKQNSLVSGSVNENGGIRQLSSLILTRKVNIKEKYEKSNNNSKYF